MRLKARSRSGFRGGMGVSENKIDTEECSSRRPQLTTTVIEARRRRDVLAHGDLEPPLTFLC